MIKEPMTEIKRKGARSIKEIPTNILEQLNCGEIESANLVEFLGVDRKILIQNLLNQYNRGHYLQPIIANVNNLQKLSANTISKAIGDGLAEQIQKHSDVELLTILSTHTSDIVRCWATYVIGQDTKLNINQMFEVIKPFAADRHFNVRECAWLDIRKSITTNITESLSVLSLWSKDRDENIRRFASEATRPRGVWCEHIAILKQNPALGLPILEPLKSDESKYVRDSVGNWLNDASKSQPEFVKELCSRWAQQSDTKETMYIIKKALRTINKSAI